MRHPHQLLTRANAYELGWPSVWIFRVLDSPALRSEKMSVSREKLSAPEGRESRERVLDNGTVEEYSAG